ncbi:MAG: FMN-binding glutamate synthase family protein [Hyphomicrobiales bacterium]|nr:FMN-binding glutamate synthase family protein [Hyphomicrobiales bacterium]
MNIVRNAFSPRFITLTVCVIGAIVFAALAAAHGPFAGFFAFLALIFAMLIVLGLHDLTQTRHSVLRNYPIAAHMRFILEDMRPEIRQYFFEDEKHGAPFSRDKRAVVYQRAKSQLDMRPFGTEYDVYDEGYEWLRHSIAPKPVSHEQPRITIGAAAAQPFSSSILNISAMSFGALSNNAIRALNAGAKIGGFAHDTGEGGVSPYHLEAGGDLIWEIGSGYFGARDENGNFSPGRFAETARAPQIKMIEIKLSQGAKPGHGGVLPGAKVTEEIARIRGVAPGRDCISPARHTAFSTPVGLMQFIAQLRELSGGKPVGFKLCIGHDWEFLAMCKAMIETGVAPDFIVVDGKEGGTGAAPLEFMDHLGMPLREGLNFAHNALVGAGLRDKLKLGASGKIVTAFDIARAMALGADWCNSARGFMFALGCIQSQSCHTGACPTGVATQDLARARALVVEDKKTRVANFHKHTLETLAELTAAAGLDHPNDFTVAHFSRRISMREVASFAELYPALENRALLRGAVADKRFANWSRVRPDRFALA